MKHKVALSLTLFVAILTTLLAGYNIFDNTRLLKIIERQNNLIKKSTGKDTEFIDKAKDISDSIKTYTNKISFIVNGTELNSNQFMKIYDKVQFERDSLKIELQNLKFEYDYAKKVYGFNIKRVVQNSKAAITLESYTRADSAAVALQFFRNRLKRTKHGWEVDTSGPEDLKKVKTKLNELLKATNDLTDTMKIQSTKQKN